MSDMKSLEQAHLDLHHLKVENLKSLGFTEDTLYIDIHEVERFKAWSQALKIDISGNGTYDAPPNTRWKKPLTVKVHYIGDMMGDVVYVGPDWGSVIGFEWKSLNDFRSSIQHESGNRLSRQLINMKLCYDAVRLIVDESQPLMTKKGMADGQTYGRVMSTLSTYESYYGQVHRRKTTNNCIHKVIEYVGDIRSGKPDVRLRESPVVERHSAELDPFIIHRVISIGLAKKLHGMFETMSVLIGAMLDYPTEFPDGDVSEALRGAALVSYPQRIDVLYPQLKIGEKTLDKVYVALFGLHLVKIPFGDSVCRKYVDGELGDAKMKEVNQWIESGRKEVK